MGAVAGEHLKKIRVKTKYFLYNFLLFLDLFFELRILKIHFRLIF